MAGVIGSAEQFSEQTAYRALPFADDDDGARSVPSHFFGNVAEEHLFERFGGRRTDDDKVVVFGRAQICTRPFPDYPLGLLLKAITKGIRTCGIA